MIETNVEIKDDDWKDSLYLCVHITETKEFINKKVLTGITNIKSYIKDVEGIIDNLNYQEILIIEEVFKSIDVKDTFNAPYTFPGNFHLTTLYRGTAPWDTENQAYKEFVDGKEVKLETQVLAIVPKRIVCLLTFPECFTNNKVGHITCLLGTYTAVDSNLVLESFFSEDKVLSDDYKSHFIEYQNSNVIRSQVFLKNQKEDVYLCFFGQKGAQVIEKTIGNMRGFKTG